jgi:hypothetical protein
MSYTKFAFFTAIMSILLAVLASFWGPIQTIFFDVLALNELFSLLTIGKIVDCYYLNDRCAIARFFIN